MANDTVTLTARYVFPVAGLPLERGLVTIQADHIVAVEPRDMRQVDFDCGNAAIVPGFVNAHTHLDLTGARGQIPPCPDFTRWLRGVIWWRYQRTAEQTHADVRVGVSDCLRFGTTAVGDVAAGGLSLEELAVAPVRGVVYYELIGLAWKRADKARRDAMRWSDSHGSPDVYPGLSPHAPYSFDSRQLKAVLRAGWPTAIHLAETAAEVELLNTHAGPFVPFLLELDAWDSRGLAWSVERVVSLMAGGERPVQFIHCNYLDPETPIPSNGTIVYCPRTHAAFGHPPHPFREFLARGVRVALGTDSLASNPDLDILAEARFLHARHPDVHGRKLLRMATVNGAEALWCADVSGTLKSRKSADLAIVALPDRDAADPHELLFASDLPVLATVFRGQRVLIGDDEPRALPDLPLPIVRVP